MKNIFFFGANSILANNLILKDNETWNKIGIYREKLEQFASLKLNCKYKLNLSQELKKNLLYNFKNSVNILENKKIIFILYSWSGTPRESINDPNNEIWNANDLLIKNFLQICKVFKPFQIIFLSSADPLYEQNLERLALESDKLKPSSPYGHQKAWAEKVLKSFAVSNNINLTTFRISPAFGFDIRFRDQGVLNKWLITAYKNEKLSIYNSLNSEINFISFNQISEAIIYSIEKEIFGVFNLGSIRSTKLSYVKDIVSKVTNKTNLKLNFISNKHKVFKVNTELFYKKSGILFNQTMESEAYKIYELIKKNLTKNK